MAVRLVCDGCTALLEPVAAVTIGDLDAVVYCAACATTWAATEAAITAARVAAIETFTAARAAAFAAARKTLQKVPDDPGEGGR